MFKKRIYLASDPGVSALTPASITDVLKVVSLLIIFFIFTRQERQMTKSNVEHFVYSSQMKVETNTYYCTLRTLESDLCFIENCIF